MPGVAVASPPAAVVPELLLSLLLLPQPAATVTAANAITAISAVRRDLIWVSSPIQGCWLPPGPYPSAVKHRMRPSTSLSEVCFWLDEHRAASQSSLRRPFRER